MNRNPMFNRTFYLSHQEISRKVAMHEAGHAAAIYLGNKQKGLPPVFFQIFLTPFSRDFQASIFLAKAETTYVAKVEGGRLIHTLPASIEEAMSGFSSEQKLAYERAFEADIVNILVGPLAEAKYIAQRDGELINPRLVNFNALHNYGGTSDLESANEYLECFVTDKKLRERKITELFLAAYNFINDAANWLAITTLADYILADEKNVIDCDEIIDVLEAVSHRCTAPRRA